MPSNRVEFVVAHDRMSTARIDHTSHGHHGIPLLRPPINKVPHKNGSMTILFVPPTLVCITQMPEQSVELVGVPMNVTNDVVVHGLFLAPLRGDRNCLLLPVTLNYQRNAAIDYATAHNAHQVRAMFERPSVDLAENIAGAQ